MAKFDYKCCIYLMKGDIMSKSICNKKIKKYSQKEIFNIESDKIKIVKCDKDVINFVEDAINTKNSNKTLYYGKINDSLAEQIYSKLGINVKNYNLSLKGSNVTKIMKDHGDSCSENLRGQIAVVKDDFKYIVDIVIENDNFYYSGKTREGKPSITFEKNIDNKYVIVESISDKHHNLEVQTMWKNKKRT